MTTEADNTHNPVPADQPLALRLSEGLGPLVAKLRDPSQATCWGTADTLMNEAADMLEACRAVGIRQEQIVMDHEQEIARLKAHAVVLANTGRQVERERWTEAVMVELDGNGQAHAIVAYATRA